MSSYPYKSGLIDERLAACRPSGQVHLIVTISSVLDFLTTCRFAGTDRQLSSIMNCRISDKPGGTVAKVSWGSPAFTAGMTPEMQLQAVNGQASRVSNLRAAILAAEKMEWRATRLMFDCTRSARNSHSFELPQLPGALNTMAREASGRRQTEVGCHLGTTTLCLRDVGFEQFGEA